MNVRILAALAVGALVAGCGKSDTKNTDLHAFAAEAASIQCNALATCSCTDPSAVPSCTLSYANMMELMMSETVVRYPGVMFNEPQGQACLADLRAAMAGCPSPTNQGYGVDTLSTGPSMGLAAKSCDFDGLFVGTQQEGEFCGSPHDCVLGLTCDSTTSQCAAGAQDASCALHGCAEGFYCDGADVCQALPTDGQPCTASSQCADGTLCRSVSGTLTCVAPHALGVDCTDGAGCVEGTYCDTTCQAALADDQPCGLNEQCVHGWCNVGSCADPGFCSMVRGTR